MAEKKSDQSGGGDTKKKSSVTHVTEVVPKTRGPKAQPPKGFTFHPINLNDKKIPTSELLAYFGLDADATKGTLKILLDKLGVEIECPLRCAYPQGYMYLYSVDAFLKNVMEWPDVYRVALMRELDPNYDEQKLIEMGEKKRKQKEKTQQKKRERESTPPPPSDSAPAVVVRDNTDHHEEEEAKRTRKVDPEELANNNAGGQDVASVLAMGFQNIAVNLGKLGKK